VPVTDIIPDIHGQAEKLRVALKNLGWERRGATWTHPEPGRRILFLGDFIDRGPENGAVIRIVRELMDAGRARAIMGNHELNALHYHTNDPDTNQPLRPRDDKNDAQHESFLKEYPVGGPHTQEVLAWMRGLPLFVEEADFRAVHAAWMEPAVRELRGHSEAGVLDEEQLIRAARKGDMFHELAEALTKGPEHRLPDGYSFIDKGGHRRTDVRLQWWNASARTWRDAATSVPDPAQLPDEPLPPSLAMSLYPADERVVFFGHYWFTGTPVLQTDNALCLDYSAGIDGPLVTYAHEHGASGISLANVTVHDGRGRQP
jgi:hypothetical protein